MKKLLLSLIVLAASSGAVHAASGADLLKSQCVACHAITKPGEAGAPDVVDAAKLAPHPKLAAADAGTVADALMALTADDLVAKGAFKGEPVSSMAALLFNKLRGCASCHSAKPGVGGVSGPDLANAGERLNPDYVVEYIRNPQKFDAHVWMPKLELTDADIQKLSGYVNALKQGAAK